MILSDGINFTDHWNGLAQVLVQPQVDAAGDTAIFVSGPQFFTALISGVVLAFAFQLLLTNLGVATGISMAGGSSSKHHSHHSSMGSTIRKIGFTLGLGTLISVTIAIFFASLLAVKLTLFVSILAGAIVGLVIWATYFSLLVWVSSTTVGSLIGSVVNTATSGFQALFGTAVAAFGAKTAQRQVVSTAEAATAAVRKELTAGIDPMGIRERVEDYIESLKPPQLNLGEIRSEIEHILSDRDLQDLSKENLPQLSRQMFADLLADRTDLSRREVDRIAKELEKSWNRATDRLPERDRISEFTDYLKSASREGLLGREFTDQLDAVIEEMRKRRRSQAPGPVSHALTQGMHSLMGIAMGRTDLSDMDVEQIVGQLKRLKSQAGEQGNKLALQFGGGEEEEPENTVRRDVENYILNAYPWQLRSPNLEVEFRDLLFDPQAEPGAVVEALERLDRTDFADLLNRKGLFTRDRVRTLSLLMDGIRLEALAVALAAEEREREIELMAEVDRYLFATSPEGLSPENIRDHFEPILADTEADYAALQRRLAPLDRQTLELMLQRRGDLDVTEIATIATELERARDRVLQASHEREEAAKAKAEAQWSRVQAYLKNTGREELNPNAISRELKLLLDDPQAGAKALRARASRFDRQTLVQLLSQRQDLSEEQVEDAIDSVERSWMKVRSAPERLSQQAQQQYDRATSAIADYLRNTGQPELNPEGIRRDLMLLLKEPETGGRAIWRRLAMMDRETLVQLLSQRDDLSEEEVNHVIDEVFFTLRTIARTPRRMALRTQEKVQNFQESLADYLRSTDREELNPDGIRRDLKLLLQDPRGGMENLKWRLAAMDRDTLVQLLSQREDLSEEEVNHIIDRILAVRDEVIAQIESIQHWVQSIIDRILNRIRNYLNDLERPELNYEGIREDIRTLFDDPEAGFEALRDRLSQFDRDTLIALLSSRDDISEAEANRIVEQIERTRNRILQRAERLQQQAQLQLERVQQEAYHQAEETRKAAAAASWWLFLTAFVSAIAAAGGGAIGVTI
ncbi:MAG: sulfite exporter TauE/SafE family protein [Limnospira sp.]